MQTINLIALSAFFAQNIVFVRKIPKGENEAVAKKIHPFKQTWAIMHLGKMMWLLNISTGHIEVFHLYASKMEAQATIKKDKLDEYYTVRRVYIHG